MNQVSSTVEITVEITMRRILRWNFIWECMLIFDFEPEGYHLSMSHRQRSSYVPGISLCSHGSIFVEYNKIQQADLANPPIYLQLKKWYTFLKSNGIPDIPPDSFGKE